MKKYLKPVLALALVAALAIGGTLAYLTDVTDELKNKFEVSEKIEIDLEETNDEFDLIPGTTQKKDPKITVIKDEAFVFAQVVETIPAAAIAGTETYETFVNYEINALYDSGVAGEIFREGATTTPVKYFWKLINVTGSDATTGAVEGDGFYVTTPADAGASKTFTYAYALVDESGNLLPVSKTDVMADPATAGAFVPAEYKLLVDDQVKIPAELNQTQLDLLLTDDTTDGDATYEVLLSFQGYAIQTVGLDALTTDEAIYNAAKGVPTK